MLNLPGYHIQGVLHESTKSCVYRATALADTGTLPGGKFAPSTHPKSVILKQLNQTYPSPAALARFRQEYTIIQHLTSENSAHDTFATQSSDAIIRAYGLESCEKTLVMVLEDFGGDSLHNLFQDDFLEPGDFLRLAIQITRALAQIHRAQVIHQDINPANIVFNPATNQLKIVDFGLATRFAQTSIRLKSPDVLEGTLAYISPEQTGRMNCLLDYRTDFYSLGVTFYELLTQTVPFQSDDSLELVHQHLAQKPPSLRDQRPDLPLGVSDIVLKLLSKNAEDRYQSAHGLRADLERCLQEIEAGRPVQRFSLGAQDYSTQLRIPQKLYGRATAIKTLLSAFDRVAKGGTPELMLVTGYSGIGKSMLVREIYKPITGRKGYFISGKFNQLQRNSPYAAVVDALSDLVRLLLSESEAQLQAWQTKLTQALGKSGQVIIDVIPDLALIMGPQPPVPKLGPMEARNRFNLLFQRFVRVFGDPEHPLVIFLDDLQWADAASLELIQLILSDQEVQANSGISARSQLLIGAYRDNEVSLTHPLTMTLKSLREDGIRQTHIALTPLSVTHIQALLADTFRCEAQAVGALAELVSAKTGGNPFFVNEFLKTLAAEDLICFDFDQGQWRWDIQQIQACDITDNVVTLMMGKLEKLPRLTQDVLCLAACMGARFDLRTLAVIELRSEAAIAQALEPAIHAGLVLTTAEPDENLLIPTYRFLHDRVQQAAYGLMSDPQQQERHLQIGQLLRQEARQQETSQPPLQRHDPLFDIVDHLNLGRALSTEVSFPLELAHLNLEAAQKSKNSTAYAAAHDYLAIGLSCLPESAWQDHYALTLGLHQE
ncbi:MAG: serine/threonine-protein kinase PknK, partial [Cyanobacteria bacterium J06635_1]